MKKIGILTFHNTTNFGSFLQTLALYKTVIDLGYYVEIIDYRCENIEKKELPSFFPDSLNPKDIIKFILFNPVKSRKYKQFKLALSEYFQLSDHFDRKTIKNATFPYDIYVVGSDILWDLELTNYDFTYFLDFVEKGKKIAFSTSVGKQWTSEDADKIKPALLEFDHIAIRESGSAEWMSDYMGRKIETVCDPTMLVERTYWDNLASKSKLKNYSKPYVLVYFPDERIIRDARKFALEKEMQVLVINYRMLFLGVKNIRPYCIEDFLYLIKHAEMVFTSSYHGILFSLYFHTPFYLYFRDNSHNVRFESLIEKMKIDDRYRKDSDGVLDEEMDFSGIDKEIEKWRNESKEILIDYICH